jgi:hypothetical protein
MSDFAICCVIQVCMAFGLAGLFWPEKFMPLFQVLLFPWSATYRTIRANSLAALGLSVLLLAHLSSLTS